MAFFGQKVKPTGGLSIVSCVRVGIETMIQHDPEQLGCVLFRVDRSTYVSHHRFSWRLENFGVRLQYSFERTGIASGNGDFPLAIAKVLVRVLAIVPID